jgi:hypothetical protein
LKVIEIPPIARLDAELVFDIKFYARFLAIFLSKMKKDWEKIDQDMSGKGKRNMVKEQERQKVEKMHKENKRKNDYFKEHPESDDLLMMECVIVVEKYSKIKKGKGSRRRERKRTETFGITKCFSGIMEAKSQSIKNLFKREEKRGTMKKNC